ncbi:uncharacterized protein LOC123645875 isoform X2 [Lemur catta]|uniref:uncharacterized protein LOC123645875 isoform X2 n=1 Tax=Lemur catta TaxID=9447 RepID=UPI001E26D3D2|nr:uncharacterized protein LOC123645875 isoform X2 [Lemur catta]
MQGFPLGLVWTPPRPPWAPEGRGRKRTQGWAGGSPPCSPVLSPRICRGPGGRPSTKWSARLMSAAVAESSGTEFRTSAGSQPQSLGGSREEGPCGAKANARQQVPAACRGAGGYSPEELGTGKSLERKLKGRKTKLRLPKPRPPAHDDRPQRVDRGELSEVGRWPQPLCQRGCLYWTDQYSH